MNVVTVTVKPSLDTTITVERMEPNRKLPVCSVENAPGGGGLNVARALNELGTRAEAVWVAGGTFGPAVERLLAAEGVPNRAIHTGETGQAIAVIEESTTDHYRFTSPGTPVTVEDAHRLSLLIEDHTEWVVVSGGLPAGSPVEVTALLVDRAAGLGAKVILDTRGDALVAALETGGVHLAKPNERELDALCDEVGVTGDQTTRARAILARYDLEALVVSLGSGGALLVTADHAERFHAPAVEVVSKIGAGDSLVAGVTHSLVAGRDVPDAVRYGIAAGSAAVTTPGTDLCRRDRTEQLYAAMPR